MRYVVVFAALSAAACTGPAGETPAFSEMPAPPSDTVDAPILYSTAEHPFGDAVNAEPLEDGGVAVVDHLNHHIAIFNESGELERTIGREGSGPGELIGPSVVTEFPDGALAVVSHRTGRITVYRDGQNPDVYPVWLQGLSTLFQGGVSPGPAVYSYTYERKVTPAEARLVKATPGRKVVIHDDHVTVPSHSTSDMLISWTENGELLRAPHPFAFGERYSINRHGDYVYLSADSSIVLGNVEKGNHRVFAYPEWPEVEQDWEFARRKAEKWGRPVPPRSAVKKLPPIMFTSLLIDDQGRVWFGRTLHAAASTGSEYTAFVLYPETGDLVAVTLPTYSFMIAERLSIRGDRGASIKEDSLGRKEVRILDLSGLPAVGPN